MFKKKKKDEKDLEIIDIENEPDKKVLIEFKDV